LRLLIRAAKRRIQPERYASFFEENNKLLQHIDNLPIKTYYAHRVTKEGVVCMRTLKIKLCIAIILCIFYGCEKNIPDQNLIMADGDQESITENNENIILEQGEDTADTSLIESDGELIKDIDGDKKEDRIYLDFEMSSIACELSSRNYVPLFSKPIEMFNEFSGIREARNGFYFFNHFMRNGYEFQFRYDSKVQRIQLIGMTRYELGGATHDNSGESSVNLLTDDYVGDWAYYSEEESELIEIPTIKAKMVFETIYFEDFDDEIYSGYVKRCAELFQQYKNEDLKVRLDNKN
jgi:hypothetical protein